MDRISYFIIFGLIAIALEPAEAVEMGVSQPVEGSRGKDVVATLK
jgi:hypothetical protein